MIRRIGLAVAAGLLAVAPGGPAVAQTSGQSGVTPSGQIINSWSLSPTGADPSRPSTRLYLSYTLAPGSVLHDSVTLWNYSNVQLVFEIYPTDASNNADGAFQLSPSAAQPKDVGSWITLPQRNVTAAANSKIDIPFTLTVPANAAPGDHAGAILAANAAAGRGADGKVVTVDRRTGSRVYLRVSGPITPTLAIEGVRTVYHGSLNPLGGSLDVTYTVRNTGNVRLAAHQQIEAAAVLGVGKKSRKLADLPELLPRNAITLHQRCHGIPALLRASATVRIRPISQAVAANELRPIERTGRTWAIPWSVIVLGALLTVGRKFV